MLSQVLVASALAGTALAQSSASFTPLAAKKFDYNNLVRCTVPSLHSATTCRSRHHKRLRRERRRRAVAQPSALRRPFFLDVRTDAGFHCAPVQPYQADTDDGIRGRQVGYNRWVSRPSLKIRHLCEAHEAFAKPFVSKPRARLATGSSPLYGPTHGVLDMN